MAKNKRVHGQNRVSPILAKMLAQAPSSLHRDSRYLRGFNLQNNREYGRLGELEAMKYGAITFVVKSSDIAVEDAANPLGYAVRDFILNGTYMELYNTVPSGMPSAEALLAKARYIAMPGRLMYELAHGFAPYLFIGFDAGDGKTTSFVRASLPSLLPKTKVWVLETLRAYEKTVF